MSGKIVEIMFFALVSLFLIHKLLSILGTADEDDRRGGGDQRSFFGEDVDIIDVTNTGMQVRKKPVSFPLAQAGVRSKEVARVQQLIADFNPDIFVQNAKRAFGVIVGAFVSGDEVMISELVDKRFVSLFYEQVRDYGSIDNLENLTAEISDINIFGNNVIIKVVFSGKGVTTGMKLLRHEWTFCKSALSQGPNWYLCNMDEVSIS